MSSQSFSESFRPVAVTRERIREVEAEAEAEVAAPVKIEKLRAFLDGVRD